jgi:cell wall-associated NlpC family hydrolase
VRCAVAVAPVRAEPRDDAEQVTQALAGEPLRVEQLEDGWARIRTAYGYPGWVQADAVEEGEGTLVADGRGTPVDVARGYVGSPYLWGGMTKEGIDCSGLVHMAFRRLGLIVPRDADQQEAAGEQVADPEPGDLVTYGEAAADHIAFWLGNGRILHSTGREGGIGVVEEDEPADYRGRRRRFVRFSTSGGATPGRVTSFGSDSR